MNVRTAIVLLSAVLCLPACTSRRAESDSVSTEVRALIDETSSPDPAERASAAAALGELGEAAIPAIPSLIRLLGDSEKTGSLRGVVWTRASSALRKIGVPAVEPLIDAIPKADPGWRWRVVSLLGNLKDRRAVNPLIATLKDENAMVRRWAASGLADMPESRAVEPLIPLLQDENVDVQRAAIRALACIGDRRAVEPLIALMTTKTFDVTPRDMAAWTLGHLNDPRAIESLLAVVEDEDDEWTVRSSAAEALGYSGDARAVEPLLALLRDESQYLRRSAVIGLGQLDDPAAAEALIPILDARTENVGVRSAAVFVLAKAKDARGIEAVSRLIDNPIDGPYLGQCAVDALAMSDDPRGFSALVAALQSENDAIRQEVPRVLAEGRFLDDVHKAREPKRDFALLKDPRVVEPLIAIVSDESEEPAARGDAALVLARTRDPRALQYLKSAAKAEESFLRIVADAALHKAEKEAQEKDSEE